MGGMNEINKTLYIPLYGKAMVSRKKIILKDPKAEMIWENEGFALKGKSKSKWLAYYMGMRAAVFDRWTKKQLREHPEAVVLHLGCGLDSRCERAGKEAKLWYDLDFPEVIEERKKYYTASAEYRMIGDDVRKTDWLESVKKAEHGIVIMEGISMYLPLLDLIKLLTALKEHFGELHVLMDCYTEFAVKASRYKNPIKDVGAEAMTGIDYPEYIADQTGLEYMREHNMTPKVLIDQLEESEQKVFKTLFGGAIARKLYRLYEYGE